MIEYEQHPTMNSIIIIALLKGYSMGISFLSVCISVISFPSTYTYPWENWLSRILMWHLVILWRAHWGDRNVLIEWSITCCGKEISFRASFHYSKDSFCVISLTIHAFLPASWDSFNRDLQDIKSEVDREIHFNWSVFLGHYHSGVFTDPSVLRTDSYASDFKRTDFPFKVYELSHQEQWMLPIFAVYFWISLLTVFIVS